MRNLLFFALLFTNYHLLGQQEIRIYPPPAPGTPFIIVSTNNGIATPLSNFASERPILIVFDPSISTPVNVLAPPSAYVITNVQAFIPGSPRTDVTNLRVTNALNIAADPQNNPIELVITYRYNGGATAVHNITGIATTPSNSMRPALAGTFNSLENYNFRVGANFDFVDKIKLNNVYGNIEVFIPALSNNNTNRARRFGMRCILAQMRSVSREDTSIAVINTRDPFYIESLPDSSRIISRKSRLARTTTIDRTLIQATPTFTLYQNPAGEENLNRIFLALNFEAVLLRKSTQLKTINFASDTISVDNGSLGQYSPQLDRIELKNSFGAWGAMIGVGFYHSSKWANFFIQSGVGISGEAVASRESLDGNSYFARSFIMSTEAYFTLRVPNITIGTHIRHAQYTFNRTEVYVYATKTISIENLAAFLNLK